jgi:hypothetical protein
VIDTLEPNDWSLKLVVGGGFFNLSYRDAVFVFSNQYTLLPIKESNTFPNKRILIVGHFHHLLGHK